MGRKRRHSRIGCVSPRREETGPQPEPDRMGRGLLATTGVAALFCQARQGLRIGEARPSLDGTVWVTRYANLYCARQELQAPAQDSIVHE